jgi:hypothetical protein
VSTPRDLTKGPTIPEVRKQMRALAGELRAIGLDDYAVRLENMADNTCRVVRAPIVRSKAKRITPILAARVRGFKRAHPGALHREIGIVFGIDGGRVSEILNGKRSPL